MATVTRRNAWGLSQWDPTILWYAKGVGAMMKRPVTDPTSWRWQGAIHGYDPAQDPFASGGGALPSAADQTRFWSRCQHSSWFFLPWHRMYLIYFERIVRDCVVKLGGPSDWALPYWNYTASGARKLPPAFRASKLPDGADNPLYVRQRDSSVLGGSDLDSSAVDVRCLDTDIFTGSGGGSSPGFGGPKTVFSHNGSVVGDLERTPHGDVHVGVGGGSGWMSSFETAGLDPIFWLHHANIDRLWEVWRRINPARANPTDGDWLDGKGAVFEFYDADKSVAKLTPRQVADTTAAPGNYVYDDTSDPRGASPAASSSAASPASGSSASAPGGPGGGKTPGSGGGGQPGGGPTRTSASPGGSPSGTGPSGGDASSDTGASSADGSSSSDDSASSDGGGASSSADSSSSGDSSSSSDSSASGDGAASSSGDSSSGDGGSSSSADSASGADSSSSSDGGSSSDAGSSSSDDSSSSAESSSEASSSADSSSDGGGSQEPAPSDGGSGADTSPAGASDSTPPPQPRAPTTHANPRTPGTP